MFLDFLLVVIAAWTSVILACQCFSELKQWLDICAIYRPRLLSSLGVAMKSVSVDSNRPSGLAAPPVNSGATRPTSSSGASVEPEPAMRVPDLRDSQVVVAVV